MAPDDMDELLFSPFHSALGKKTVERIGRQLENYDYYNGLQHEDQYGQLVNAKDLERPAGLDYDPTRYSTNYFKAIIDRKARWQMGGTHGISVPRRQFDDIEDVLNDDYVPGDGERVGNNGSEE